MTVLLIRSSRLYAGAPYAYASIAPAGGLIFTAGACPIDQNVNVLSIGNYVGQARYTLANLVTALEAASASLSDVLKTTVYVASTDRADLYSVRRASLICANTNLPA